MPPPPPSQPHLSFIAPSEMPTRNSSTRSGYDSTPSRRPEIWSRMSWARSGWDSEADLLLRNGNADPDVADDGPPEPAEIEETLPPRLGTDIPFVVSALPLPLVELDSNSRPSHASPVTPQRPRVIKLSMRADFAGR